MKIDIGYYAAYIVLSLPYEDSIYASSSGYDGRNRNCFPTRDSLGNVYMWDRCHRVPGKGKDSLVHFVPKSIIVDMMTHTHTHGQMAIYMLTHSL